MPTATPIVYDYSVPLSSDNRMCQQYSYDPPSGGFQVGLKAPCLWTDGYLPTAACRSFTRRKPTFT